MGYDKTKIAEMRGKGRKGHGIFPSLPEGVKQCSSALSFFFFRVRIVMRVIVFHACSGEDFPEVKCVYGGWVSLSQIFVPSAHRFAAWR